MSALSKRKTRPSVKVDCGADHYGLPGERIVEFSSKVGGGLISLRVRDGQLYVELYRLDPNVVVRYVSPHGTGTVQHG